MKNSTARVAASVIWGIGLLAGCGGGDDSTMDTAASETTAAAAATTATTQPDVPPEPGAPRVIAVALSDGEALSTIFGPSDKIWMQIDLDQMTDEVELNLRAEAIAGFGVREGFAVKGLTSEKLLERGDDHQGPQYTHMDRVSAPSDGWDVGDYRLWVTIEIVDRTGAYATSTWSDEFDFTVNAP